MSQDVIGLISWLRSWFDDIYALKGSGGGLSFDDVYPVGSIYMSVNNTSPSTLFGGTWQKIQGRFLLASGTTSGEDPSVDNTYTLGDTDGEATHSLTQSEMPRHTHIQNSHNHTQNSHQHQLPNSAIVYYSSDSGSLPNGTAKKYVTNTTPKLKVDSATATNQAETATNKYTGGTGSSESASNGVGHNNMPPYLVVNVWKRTA